jgi:cation diffusion facilitator family transporter
MAREPDDSTAPTTRPHTASLGHDHAFGQDRRRPGETRTLIVIAVTATMMIVEVAAGVAFGSMALLADGLHMASHAAALGINAFAYAYARRHAHDAAFSFGTGKVNTLGGFTGAVLLAGFALLMASESIQRFVVPVPIAFDHAIAVAVLGLVVNGVSMWILGHEHASHERGAAHERHAHAHAHAQEGHDHDDAGHDDDHEHDHGDDRGFEHDHGHGHDLVHHDHNLASAYLHVLADALTSLLAIVALLAAKYFGFAWMDPAMGLVGAVLVARWSIGLLRATSAVLLDRSPPEIREAIRASLEQEEGTRVTDLHVWSIGVGLFAVQATIVSPLPQSPDHYKALLPTDRGLVHVGIEVHPLDAPAASESGTTRRMSTR